MTHLTTAALLFIGCVAVCLAAYFYEKEIESMRQKRDVGKPFIDCREKLPPLGSPVEIKQVGGLINHAYLDKTKTERIFIFVLPQRGVYLGLPDVVGWRERE
jgi:hypothetical protein